MWHTRAVVSILVEEIAGLALSPRPDAPAGKKDLSSSFQALEKAARRARLVVVIDLLAILILFLFRDASRPFLPSGQTVETVFTFGVLAVAAHAGLRWGQLQNYRTVARVCDELVERSGD